MPERIEDYLGPDFVPTPKQGSLTGAPTIREQREIEEEAKKIPFRQHAAQSAGALHTAATTTISRAFIEDDPDYDQQENVEYYMQGLPEEYRRKFVGNIMGPRSHVEAQLMRDHIIGDLQRVQNAQNAGLKGTSALLLGTVLDPVQAPFMLTSGGTIAGARVANSLSTAGKLSKVGSAIGPRGRSTLSVGAAGAEAGLYTGVAETAVIPTSQGEDVQNAILGGTSLGGILGGASKMDFSVNAQVGRLQDEVRMNSPASTYNPTKPHGPAPVRPTMTEEGSLGAGAIAGQGPDITGSLNASQTSYMRGSQKRLNESGFIDQITFDESPLGKQADSFQKAINTYSLGALTPDSERLMSWGPTGTLLAFDALESPMGRYRNNTSSAMLNHSYFNDIIAPIAKGGRWRKLKDAWARDKGHDGWSRVKDSRTIQADFGREVSLAQNSMYHTGKYPDDIHPAIQEMAELNDELYRTALVKAKGLDGENPVQGFETLEARNGFQRQAWRPDVIEDIIKRSDNPAQTRLNMERSIANTYRKLYPTIDSELIDTMAKALVTRQVAKAKGMDMNLYTMLDQDGDKFLIEVLQDNGFSLEKAERFVDQLKGRDADKGKLATAKSRMDVDLSTPIEGTDLQLVDLIDTDPYRVPAMYARQISGAAALARKGYQWADWPDLKNQIKAEALATGKSWSIADDTLLEGMASYFRAGPIAGGLSPAGQRVHRLTNLSLLNQLGLTQLAETGVIVAAVGMDHFWDASKSVFKKYKGTEGMTELSQLDDIDLMIGQYHHAFDSEYALDYVKQSTNVQSQLASSLDSLLAKGQRVQGYTSGFYWVQARQQEIAVVSVLKKMNKLLTEGNMSTQGRLRLGDMGLRDASLDKVSRYFENGTVRKLEDGTLDFQFDKWKPQDLDELKAALYRFADNHVNRPHAGEESILWSTELGKLLTHLRTFTLTTQTKTFGRNMRYMDDTTRATFLYGFATAGGVYAAKQIVNGRPENITPEKMARGAFGMSNMTSWMPMFYDPAMSMLGMDDMRLNHYGARGVTSDVFGAPPSFSALNRMAHIPLDAVPSVLTGKYNNEDLYALKATPLVGNLYGFSAVLNGMKK